MYETLISLMGAHGISCSQKIKNGHTRDAKSDLQTAQRMAKRLGERVEEEQNVPRLRQDWLGDFGLDKGDKSNTVDSFIKLMDDVQKLKVKDHTAV